MRVRFSDTPTSFSLCSTTGLPLYKRPVVLRPRLATGLPFSQRSSEKLRLHYFD